MAEKPLNVRVAEARGWELREITPPPQMGGGKSWRGIGPGGTWMWGGREIPPYGEESSAGWACTGPLIAEYGIVIGRTHVSGPDIIPGPGPWFAHTPKTDAVEADAPCAAVGEWVARYGGAK